MAAIAVRQACGAAAAAQQQTLLALGLQNQRLGAVGCALGHFSGVPAAAQAMGFTGFDQANFWEDGERIIGHGWAYVARMESGERRDCSFPDCIRATDYSTIGSLSHLWERAGERVRCWP